MFTREQSVSFKKKCNAIADGLFKKYTVSSANHRDITYDKNIDNVSYYLNFCYNERNQLVEVTLSAYNLFPVFSGEAIQLARATYSLRAFNAIKAKKDIQDNVHILMDKVNDSFDSFNGRIGSILMLSSKPTNTKNKNP